MKASIIPNEDIFGTPKPTVFDKLARKAVLRRLESLKTGRLTLVDGDTVTAYGQAAWETTLQATLRIHDPAFYSEVAFGGSIGAGEAYMLGYWSTDDLTRVVRILARNMQVVDDMDGGLARLTAPLQKIFHWLHRNTRQGSQRNIAAHYDLGNDLFRLMLDDTMMYSSGIFETAHSSLNDASIAKLDRICRKLDLRPEDHVIEIGTGWGGFAIHAATHYGCRVTTTTISREQYALAQERVEAAGLQDRVTLLLRDYRDLEGQFDKLVSIEMIEAVGHQYFDTFFRKCGELLKPDGMMLLQAITIADQRYESARDSVDFIKRYIFPGCCIPSITAMANSVAAATDMKLFHLEDIGPHYATTLRHWRDNVFAQLEAVRALGYPERFIRMWEFYLSYCEGGFAERGLGDVQMLLTKPQCRRGPLVPPLASHAA
jgi:cyclopropane-fatty-acyl-phospholipid synthase